MGPRWSQDGARWSHDGPRLSQDVRECAPRKSKNENIYCHYRHYFSYVLPLHCMEYFQGPLGLFSLLAGSDQGAVRSIITEARREEEEATQKKQQEMNRCTHNKPSIIVVSSKSGYTLKNDVPRSAHA